MRFEDRLEQAAVSVNKTLSSILDEVEDDVPEPLMSAIRYGLLGNGKRLRAFLLMASAGIFGVEAAESLRAAAALECLHCYSLVHDDLPAMDDDLLRRGRPTVHVSFGEATAILTGDALLTLAFEILADDRCHPDPATRVQLSLRLARAAGARAMIGGQALDLKAEKAAPDEADVMRLQAMKTGALLRYAVEAGALIGRSDAASQAALSCYGTAIGAAFQIADDLLDVEGCGEEAGKKTGKDAQAGKGTLIALLGIDGARRRLAQHVDEAISSLAMFGSVADPLREAADFVMTRRK